MSAQAQEFIAKVRDAMAKQDWTAADKMIAEAPKDRADWTAQENDEVLCLEEFLTGLKDPAFN